MSKYKLREYRHEFLLKHYTKWKQHVGDKVSGKEMLEFEMRIYLGTTKEDEHIGSYIRILLYEVKDKCHEHCKLMHIKHINRDRNSPELLGLKEEEIYKFAVINSYSEKEVERFINVQEAVQYCKSNGYVLEYK